MLIEISTPHQEAIAQLKGQELHLLMQTERVHSFRRRVLPHAIAPGDETFQDNEALETFDEFLPTYFFIKLGTFVDRTIELMWEGKFPGRSQGKLYVHEKLAQLGGVADIHQETVRQLKRLRNACAHTFLAIVTWDHFYQHRNTLSCITTTLWRDTFGDNDVIRGPR